MASPAKSKTLTPKYSTISAFLFNKIKIEKKATPNTPNITPIFKVSFVYLKKDS